MNGRVGEAGDASPRLMFVGIAGEPGADRIVADMGGLGASCAVVAPALCFAARTRYASRVYACPAWRWRPLRALWLTRRIEAIVADWRPDLVIPLDDASAAALRDGELLAGASPALRGLVVRSLGDDRFFEIASSRRALMRLARSLGLRTPREADAPDFAHARWAAEAFGYPLVFKRDQSCGGLGVAIARDDKALAGAYAGLRRQAQLRRLAGGIPGYRTAGSPPITAQEFIPGALAYRVAACHEGRELEGLDFRVVEREPFDTAPGRYVQGITHPEMAEASGRIVAALKLSGLASFDFILNGRGEAVLIEINARPAHSGHLGAWFGHDLYAALLRRPRRWPASRPPETIALFPRAIDHDPRNRDLERGAHVFHDVPWDDPEALAAYRLWLDRRHPEAAPVLGSRRAPPIIACAAE